MIRCPSCGEENPERARFCLNCATPLAGASPPGEVRKTVEGKGFLVRPAYDPKVEDFIRPLFQQYYTMSFDNYPVEMERIEHPEVQKCLPVN